MSTQGRLAAVMTAANNPVLAYTVPADTVTTATIAAVNTGTEAATVKMYITTGSTPTVTDAIEYGAVIQPGGVLERSCMPLGAGERIIVEASSSSIAVRVAGFEAEI